MRTARRTFAPIVRRSTPTIKRTCISYSRPRFISMRSGVLLPILIRTYGDAESSNPRTTDLSRMQEKRAGRR